MLNGGQLGEEMTELVSFCVHKTKRKVRVAAATAGTGVAGGASTGILAGTAITGAVNAWNPGGWTLLAVAAVGGCGIVGYKVYRRATRK